MITWDSKYSTFLIWPIFSLGFMGTAYLLNKPEMLGKNSKGTINPIILILNLPWLVFQYLVWHIQYFISKENAFDKINGLDVYVGRRPRNINELPAVDLVIDLASEFVENKKVREEKEYLNVPMLDAKVPPKKLDLTDLIKRIKEKTIYIHCAQGHGRTALFTSLLLKETGFVKTLSEGIEKIQYHRPLAKLNKKQNKFIGCD
ncbi:MAG: hypothetical protein ACXACY_22840 [Candidatus Hodarchaeales archaeon]|jgi:hypothetical protein